MIGDPQLNNISPTSFRRPPLSNQLKQDSLFTMQRGVTPDSYAAWQPNKPPNANNYSTPQPQPPPPQQPNQYQYQPPTPSMSHISNQTPTRYQNAFVKENSYGPSSKQFMIPNDMQKHTDERKPNNKKPLNFA